MVCKEFWSPDEPLHYMHYIRHAMAKPMMLTIWRDGRESSCSIQLSNSSLAYRKIYSDVEDVPFSIRGGLVVGPIRKGVIGPHPPRVNEYDTSLLYVIRKEAETSFSFDEDMDTGSVIISVNSIPVRTLKEYESAWEDVCNSTQTHIYIETIEGSMSACSIETAKMSEEQLRSRLSLK